MEKFIVTPKEDKTVTMTIRIDRALQEEYNRLEEQLANGYTPTEVKRIPFPERADRHGSAICP